MASLSRDKSGGKRILFQGEDGKRQAIRLGDVPVKDAERFLGRVESLISAKLCGTSIDQDTARWVTALPDKMYERIVRAGLAQPRERTQIITLVQLLDRFVEAAVVKPATKAAYRQTTKSLLKHFGSGTRVDHIKEADADRWRKALADEGLAQATQAKRTHIARSIFSRAVRWGYIERSPFEGVKSGTQVNPDRWHYVDSPTIEAVLDACPDAQWRAIVGLCRYAGLRCPSEVVLLRWGDVDWERGRMMVRSPKTQAHDGHAVRTVPIDQRLRGILQSLFEQAEEGVEAVVPRLRNGKVNLRTHLTRIIERAGVKPWPRLVQNLRASCATDWTERYPNRTVAAWLGHSALIGATHYVRSRDEYIDLAAGLGAGCEEPQGDNGRFWGPNGGAKSGAPSAQKAAQHAPAPVGTGWENSAQVFENFGFTQTNAGECRSTRNLANGRRGIRTPEGVSQQIYSLPRLSTPASALSPRRGRRPEI